MSTLLGLPPDKLIDRGSRPSSKQNPDMLRYRQLGDDNIKGRSLEDSITAMTGEDKRLFLVFVRRMLQWMPEDRATAGQLLDDPWLSYREVDG